MDRAPKGKKLRNEALSARALADLQTSGSMIEHLKAFLRFLALNRNASPHTVRAYDSDLTQFIGYAAAQADLKKRDLQPSPTRS